MASLESKNANFSQEQNDEFDEYLKTQCLKTTFNGLEIESFTWFTNMINSK